MSFVAKFAQIFSIAQLGTLIGAIGHYFGASFERYSGNDDSIVANVRKNTSGILR